ncbi:MAG: radical SAM protein [Bdellovibrionota bacterium]
MFIEIEEKVSAQADITVEDACWLYNNASDIQLQQLATAVKTRYHEKDSATFLIMAIVNYTNICVAKCTYCSFYRLPHQSGIYLLSFEQVCEKIDQLLSFGGTLVGFNGGFHPKLTIYDYAELFRKVHERYPDLTFYEMTVAEFMFSCKVSKISYEEGAKVLHEVGTRWVTGGGAEVLVDSFRQRHSPGKFKVEDYYRAQKAILDAGMGSTATMVIGFDESLEERLAHIERLRDFQYAVGNKLTSFLCWTYKPYGNELAGQEISSGEYLRWLAICRIYLSNFRHIRTSVLTKNTQALSGLAYGANDFDLPTEDEVTEKAGASINVNFDELIAFARKEGFNPTLRKPFS